MYTYSRMEINPGLASQIVADGIASIPGKKVSQILHELLRIVAVPKKEIAHGMDIPEAQLNRMASGRTAAYRPQTLLPLRRLAILIDEGRKTLTEEGLREWLAAPNPYLSDVSPILCLRTDKELEKVLSLLASIRYGFPA